MQAMSYLSVAHGTTLYDIYGNAESNLWDAYQRIANEDESGVTKGYSLEFAKFSPLSASEITSDTLNDRGVFLKPVTKSTVDFEDWLVYQDEKFADEVYKRNNHHHRGTLWHSTESSPKKKS